MYSLLASCEWAKANLKVTPAAALDQNHKTRAAIKMYSLLAFCEWSTAKLTCTPTAALDQDNKM